MLTPNRLTLRGGSIDAARGSGGSRSPGLNRGPPGRTPQYRFRSAPAFSADCGRELREALEVGTPVALDASQPESAAAAFLQLPMALIDRAAAHRSCSSTDRIGMLNQLVEQGQQGKGER